MPLVVGCSQLIRKTDMLIADLQLKQDATPSGRRKRKTRPEEDEAAYHFIAFIPVESKLWKLDGLQPRPQNLGKSVFFVL